MGKMRCDANMWFPVVPVVFFFGHLVGSVIWSASVFWQYLFSMAVSVYFLKKSGPLTGEGGISSGISGVKSNSALKIFNYYYYYF